MCLALWAATLHLTPQNLRLDFKGAMSSPQCSQGIGVRLGMRLAFGCVTGMLKEPQADQIGGDKVLCLQGSVVFEVSRLPAHDRCDCTMVLGDGLTVGPIVYLEGYLR